VSGIEIRRVKEHYEVYQNGLFLFSGDTLREVEQDLEEMEEQIQMREIKFRGKRVDSGEWVYGYLLICGITGKTYIFPYGDDVNESDKVGEEGCLKLVTLEVIPETVGQYTGLKDKNGKEIYEEDIVEGFLSLHPDRKIHRVVYEDNGFYYRDEDGVGWHPDHITCVEVIYDNPELLEMEEKK